MQQEENIFRIGSIFCRQILIKSSKKKMMKKDLKTSRRAMAVVMKMMNPKIEYKR